LSDPVQAAAAPGPADSDADPDGSSLGVDDSVSTGSSEGSTDGEDDSGAATDPLGLVTGTAADRLAVAVGPAVGTHATSTTRGTAMSSGGRRIRAGYPVGVEKR
jgi:hypothetical protein